MVKLQYTDEGGALQSGVLSYGLGQEKPKHSKDIARITFDVYKQSPRDLFGSLNIKATFYGLYSMSCDIQGLGPKKILRSEATRHTFPPLQLQLQQFLLMPPRPPTLLALPCGKPPASSLWPPPRLPPPLTSSYLHPAGSSSDGPPHCCKAWAICCWGFPPPFVVQ